MLSLPKKLSAKHISHYLTKRISKLFQSKVFIKIDFDIVPVTCTFQNSLIIDSAVSRLVNGIVNWKLFRKNLGNFCKVSQLNDINDIDSAVSKFWQQT